MLLKKLKLKNFRQFNGEQVIEFASSKKGGIIVVMGENGSGKTTLAQAFRWCLYGETSFEDREVVSKSVIQELDSGDSQTFVEIVLEHNGREFTIKRTQKFKCNGQNFRLDGQPHLRVYCKALDGQTEELSGKKKEEQISEILPKELSPYFFFSGERLTKMSEEIINQKKNKDFSDAVAILLGLLPLKNGIQHLIRVEQNISREYREDTNGEIETLLQKIKKYEEEITKIDKRLGEIKEEEDTGKQRLEELDRILIENKSSEELGKQRKKLETDIKQLNNQKQENIKDLLNEFQKNGAAFLANHLIERALDRLKDADKLDKGIPYINEQTINYLIERRSCLCGCEVRGLVLENLENLKNYIPPKAIGQVIEDFRNGSSYEIEYAREFLEKINKIQEHIASCDDQIYNKQDEIKDISKQIATLKDVTEVEKERDKLKRSLPKLREESAQLYEDRGKAKADKEKAEKEKDELMKENDENAVILRCKNIAEQVSNRLTELYVSLEVAKHQELEAAAKKIFSKIYSGEIEIALNKNYEIEAIASGVKTELSTAQSYAVILAFIVGIIEIARRQGEKKNDHELYLIEEAYPLVMDAPLSAFDKERIGTICSVLKNSAEQVVIFIKDTDGD